MTKIQVKTRYPQYESYKSSGIEWLGEIPEKWDIKRLRFLTKFNPPYRGNLKENQLISFLPMQAVSEKGKVEYRKKELKEVLGKYTPIQNGDVIVAKITPCFENGKGAFVDDLENSLGFSSSEFHVLRAYGEIDAQFLYYLTMSYPFRTLGEIDMYGAAGQQRVSELFIKDFSTPIPPKETQEHIANFLDEKTEKIDSLVNKNEKLIERLKEYRQSLISKAVTKGLDPNAKMKDSGVEWLGKIPEDWDNKKVKYLLHPDEKSQFPASFGKEDGKYVFFTSSQDTKRSDEYTYNKPGIILGTGGFVNIHYSENKFATSADCWVLSNGNKYLIKFIYYYLWSIKNVIDDIGFYGQGLRHLDKSFIKNTNLGLPPKEEQQKIADYLDKKTEKIDGTINKTEYQIELLKEYRQSLISSAVTGKIKV